MGLKNKFERKYLSSFYDDLLSIIDYIQIELKNPEAASALLDDVEAAINKRMDCPLSFETLRFDKKRALPYRRIFVRNFIIYYVVYDETVEFRRILYKRQDTMRL